MESIKLFKKFMIQHSDIVLEESKISFESTELYQDEIDEKLISIKHLKQLPNPILFDTLLYEDDKGNDWIAGIAVNPETREREYIVLILNGEPITHRFLKRCK
ncbi:hypothetical protein [Niallia nealsonii]|uniref:Uncharacterized protein n=1 Tax=Niallia nealsonii TaxID=115979 RepID=A0A2N0Z444_9BACI|nr:hypothetical protein [Niallia nealsonii]PKG24283.1 hypothetical protein CWS01_07795 [Niallia nealsonii]